MARTRIVVFDLGGVLVRVSRSWEEAHERAGLSADALPIDPVFRAEMRRLVALHELGEMGLGDLATRVSGASAGRYTPDGFLAMYAALCLEEFPGVGEVFDALEAAGLDTGLLSNTNETHWARLVHLVEGEPEYPTLLRARHRHASHLFGLAKPDPRIYRAFEERSGYAPGDILFFDDRAENAQGARAVGWDAEHVDPDQPTVGQILRALAARGISPRG